MPFPFAALTSQYVGRPDADAPTRTPRSDKNTVPPKDVSVASQRPRQSPKRGESLALRSRERIDENRKDTAQYTILNE